VNPKIRKSVGTVAFAIASFVNSQAMAGPIALQSNTAYVSCDAACNNPVNSFQQTSTNSALTFSDDYGSIYARSGYGVLRAGVVSTFVGDGHGSFLSESAGTANGAWYDTVQYIGGTGIGSASFNLRIDGSFGLAGETMSGSASGMSFIFSFNNQALTVSMSTASGTSNVNGAWDGQTLSGTFDFYYGVTYDIYGLLEAYSDFGGFSDFSHTVTLEIVVPEGAALVTGSGASYQPEITAIAEPEMVLLFFTGLLAMTFGRRRIEYSNSNVGLS